MKESVFIKSFFFFQTRVDSKKGFALPSWRWSHFCDKSNLFFHREIDSVHWKRFHVVVSKTTFLFLCLRLLKQKVLSPFKSTESKQCLCNRYLQIKHLNQHLVLQKNNFICRLDPFWWTEGSGNNLKCMCLGDGGAVRADQLHHDNFPTLEAETHSLRVWSRQGRLALCGPQSSHLISEPLILGQKCSPAHLTDEKHKVDKMLRKPRT